MSTAAVVKEARKQVFTDLENIPVTDKRYTPFWPVFMVFLFFTITSVLQLISNIQARHNMQAAVAQLSKGITEEKIKSAALTGLAGDLIDLSSTSLPAQQIVNDFRIQRKNPAPATKSPSTTTNTQ